MTAIQARRNEQRNSIPKGNSLLPITWSYTNAKKVIEDASTSTQTLVVEPDTMRQLIYYLLDGYLQAGKIIKDAHTVVDGC